jgi:Na+(H+)/acetate symporter ActP
MIIYTVRGGASAVIWTDVVQLFVYVAGAAVVFVSLLALIPGGWAEVVAPARGRQVSRLRPQPRLSRPLHAVGGHHRRRRADAVDHGTDQFLVQRLLAARTPREAAAGWC